VRSIDKLRLRRQFCALRECLPIGKDQRGSYRSLPTVASWPVLRDAQTVLIYLAFKNELDLGLLFDLLSDIYWIAPHIEGRRLILRPYDPARLVRHHFGMLEPAVDMPVVDPTTLALALVPGVVFGRRGRRLGFGRGFYDRFLITTPALRAGVTYDKCLADELTCSKHDQWMDWAVTPSELIAAKITK
jgi:5-formyltetrahydrofolate cyclo-ligase